MTSQSAAEVSVSSVTWTCWGRWRAWRGGTPGRRTRSATAPAPGPSGRRHNRSWSILQIDNKRTMWLESTNNFQEMFHLIVRLVVPFGKYLPFKSNLLLSSSSSGPQPRSRRGLHHLCISRQLQLSPCLIAKHLTMVPCLSLGQAGKLFNISQFIHSIHAEAEVIRVLIKNKNI